MKSIYIISFLACIFQIQSLAQCHEYRHSMKLNDTWISCNANTNPNSERGEGHWLMYDLGDIYKLGRTHFWNINQSERSSYGMSEIVIDISNDGNNWSELVRTTLQRAEESSLYEGETGPELTGANARYVLITALSNYGGSCYGLNEVRIENLGLADVTNIVDRDHVSYQLQFLGHPFDNEIVWKTIFDRSDKYNYSITDQRGKVLVQNQNYHNEVVRLNAKDLPSGAYLLSIKYDDSIISELISIIH